MDPTFEINLETVKERAIKGVAALTGRKFVVDAISFVSFGILGAYLSAEQFGVYWIVSAIKNFLAYFSDIGLAAALIQKKGKPSQIDLKTTFTIQQGLVLTLLLILYFITPLLRRTHNLSDQGVLLLYALGFSFLMSSLKSIPSVLLERRLEFSKLIIPHILETLVYSIVVVIFALKGFGIMSFTYAVVSQSIVGLVSIYLIQPWKPGFAISKDSLKDLLKFGVPYQVNTLIAVFKDDGMTILLGGVLGPVGLGLLGMAQRLSQYPLRFFMDNVTRVSFPAFSRMQHDKKELSNALNRSIFFICFLVFPSIVGLVVLAPVLTSIVPKYGKWTPALIPLAFLATNTMIASVSTQLTNLFNAIGKIKITFKLMLMWSTLTFALVPYLSIKYSVVGASVGYALVGASSVVAIIVAKKLVNFSITESVFKPLVASLMMGFVMYFMTVKINQTISVMFIEIAVGVFIYAFMSILIIGKSVILDFKKGIRAFVNR